MKLGKIKKAMTRKTLYIVNGEDGFQWIGDGSAFYIADKNLDLSDGNLLAILDIDEDKRSEYTVREIDGEKVPELDICPQEDCDKLLHPLVSLSWTDELETIMTTEDGEAVAVDQAYIAPADGKEPLMFVLRRSVNRDTGEIRGPVVVVFRDMLCCAVIMPIGARTMTEIWAVMRKACAEGLRYCGGRKRMTKLITQRELATMFDEAQCYISQALMGLEPKRKMGREYEYDPEEAMKAIHQWYMGKRARHVAEAQRWTMKAMGVRDQLRKMRKEAQEG